jgi:hypothetical protein
MDPIVEEEWRRRLQSVVEALPYTGATAMAGQTGSQRRGPSGGGDGRADLEAVMVGEAVASKKAWEKLAA